MLATDHCSFLRHHKDVLDGDYRAVPCGLPGIGSLLPLTYNLVVGRLHQSLAEVADVLSRGPAQRLGLFPRKGSLRVGADADLIILNSEGPARPLRSTLTDCHEPYAGRVGGGMELHLDERSSVAVEGSTIVEPGPFVTDVTQVLGLKLRFSF